jgi:hypothetical protein
VRPRDAAIILGKAEVTIWKMLQRGELEAVRDGPRCTRILMDSIDRRIASMPKFVPGENLPANVASQKRAAAKRRRA